MTRRYNTVTTRGYVTVASVFAVIGVGIAGLLAFMFSSDPGASWLNLVPFGSIALGFILGPAVFVFFKREYLLVDLEQRQATLYKSRKQAWTCRLDDLGPIGFLKTYSDSASDDQNRRGTTVVYRVLCRGLHTVPIYEAYTYEDARKRGERLAREWKVALATMDGQYHAPSQREDGQQRLRVHASATSETPKLGRDCGVSFEKQDGVIIIRSKVLSRKRELPNVLYLACVFMGGAALYDIRAGNVLAAPFDNPGATFMTLVALAFVIGPGLKYVAELIRFAAPRFDIAIDARQVSHGGTSIPLVDVREVTFNESIVILSDHQRIQIDPSFCRTKDTPAFIAELRRLIAAGASAVDASAAVV